MHNVYAIIEFNATFNLSISLSKKLYLKNLSFVTRNIAYLFS